jgi:hypothetical protein
LDLKQKIKNPLTQKSVSIFSKFYLFLPGSFVLEEEEEVLGWPFPV